MCTRPAYSRPKQLAEARVFHERREYPSSRRRPSTYNEAEGAGPLLGATGNETKHRNPYTILYKSSAKAVIDTLSIVESLTDAGVEQKQAKAHAQAIANVVSEQRKDGVMHSDLADLKAGIAANKAGIIANKAAIDANKAGIDTLKWMAGVNMAITLALFAVVLAG